MGSRAPWAALPSLARSATLRAAPGIARDGTRNARQCLSGRRPSRGVGAHARARNSTDAHTCAPRAPLHAPHPGQGVVTRCAVSVPSPVTVAVTLFAPNVALATG